MLMIVCLWVSDGYGEDNKIMRVAPLDVRREVSPQKNLPNNAQPGVSKLGQDVPSKNSRFIGRQDGYKPVQFGGGQSQGFLNNQGQGLPQGGADWQKKPRGNQNNKGSVNDLSRDAQLTKLADPTAGIKDITGKDPNLSNRFSDRPSGKSALTGGDNEIQNFLATTLTRGAGKNQSSKQSQQSEESDNDDITDQNGNFMGKRGELKRQNDEQMNGGLTGEEREAYIKTSEDEKGGGLSGAERAAYIKDNEEYQRAHVKDAAEAEKMKVQQEKELDQQLGNPDNEKTTQTKSGDYTAPPSGGDTAVTPDPDAVDESHLPDFLRHKKNMKSPQQVEEEKKRQVGLPGEGSNHGGLRRDDIQVTAQDMLAKRTDNRTQPIEGDGTTTNVGAGTNPNVEIDPVTGQPKKDKTHGGGGDPADPNT